MSEAARPLATVLAHHAANCLPHSRAAWADAIRHEVEFIDNDKAALRWAAGCVLASYAERINPMSNAAISPILSAGAMMAFIFGAYIFHGGHMEMIFAGLPTNLVLIVLGAAAVVSIRTTIGGPGLLSSIGLAMRGRGFHKGDYRNLAAALLHKLNDTSRGLSLPPGGEAVRMIDDATALMARDQVSAEQLDAVLKNRIDRVTDDQRRAVQVLRTFGRTMLWFGGVSVMLGSMHTLSAFSYTTEVLAGMFASAMLGFLVGVLMAAGIIQPLANRLEAAIADDANFYGFIRTAFFCRKAGSDAATAVQVASGALPAELGLDRAELAAL